MPDIKPYIYAGVTALILLLGGVGYFLYKSNLSQAETIGAQSVVVKDNAVTAVVATGTVAVTNDAITATNKDKQATNTVVAVVKTTAKKKIVAVNTKYDALPKTPDNVASEAKEKSLIRITSLWEQFCSENNPDPQCAAYRQTLTGSQA